jgi:transposase
VTTATDAPHAQLPPFPSLPGWFNWPFTADPLLVSGWAFWIGLIGFFVSLIGFWLTLKQLKTTRSAADAARDEALRIEQSLNRYEIVNEVSRSITALEAARKYLRSSLFAHVADSYEIVRDGFEALKADASDQIDPHKAQVEEACEYIRTLSARIEQGVQRGNVSINVPKTLVVMAEHRQLLSSISRIIEKGVIK